jgi:pyrroline-5-carboxylate reductase
MKVAILGAGNLGLSMAKGLVKSDHVSQLILTKRNVLNLQDWASNIPVLSVSDDNKWAVSQADVIVVAVQPGQWAELAEQIKPVVSAHHLMISTMTGITIAAIEESLGDLAVVRSMPNTAAAVEQSMTCISANDLAETKMDMAHDVLGVLGKTMVIQESLMQAATVVCASGIAFWMRLIRASTQGAIQLGFDAPEAKQMAVQTCLGAATLLEKMQSHPEEEIDRVTTPKGCTIEGLNEMEHQGLSSALIKGLVTSYQKIEEIKKSVS